MGLMARLGAFGGRGETPAEGGTAPAAISGPLRVAALLEPETAAALANIRTDGLGADIKLIDSGLAAFAANGPSLRRADVVIVEIDPDNAAALAALEQFASVSGARLPVIAAARDLTISATRRLMRSAIADVLPIPFTLEELGQALDTARGRLTHLRSGSGGVRTGNIIAFHGALGGIGTSMIATQVAQMWAEDRSVLLIDLDVQRGNAALYMNLKPRLTITDLLEAEDRLDVEFLRMVAERHQSGASVIATPGDMMAIDAITPEFVDRLLDLCVQNFDLVLLDLPGTWIDWTASAMQKSDVVVLVTQMTVSGVQQARRQLDVMEANGLGDRVRVVMNRMTAGLFGKYDTSEAENVLRSRVHFAVSNDYPTVAAALDEGKALKQIKLKARIDKELRQMAAGLVEELAQMGATA